mgnify:CR=1 FL=1
MSLRHLTVHWRPELQRGHALGKIGEVQLKSLPPQLQHDWMLSTGVTSGIVWHSRTWTVRVPPVPSTWTTGLVGCDASTVTTPFPGLLLRTRATAAVHPLNSSTTTVPQTDAFRTACMAALQRD